MEIKKPYNPYQEAKYKLAFSTNPSKKVKASAYVVSYNGRVLTNPKSYPQCVEDKKIFMQMGKDFPNKELIQIKPYKG